MKRTATIMFVLLALFILPFVCGAGQENSSSKTLPASKKMRRTKPEIQNVYSDQWDSGEIKHCATYSGQPALLICDDTKVEWKGAFIHMVGDNTAAGMVGDEAYHRAFVDATAKSKQFMVEFYDSLGRDPNPWPKPQTGQKLSSWRCTKDKIVSCSLYGREE